MLAAFGAVRSSPGVTTAALTIASCLDSSVLVEADWDGGVLGARLGLAREPGLTTLAAASRANPSEDVTVHAQALPGGTLAVPAPASAGSAVGVWTSAGSRLAGVLRTAAGQRPVLADVGRLSPLSPVAPLLDAADVLVVVARPTVEELHAAAARIDDLQRKGARPVAMLLIGERPYGPDEVAAQLQVNVLGALADDRRAADAISGRGSAVSTRVLRRSPLARSARDVAERLITAAGQQRRRAEEVSSA